MDTLPTEKPASEPPHSDPPPESGGEAKQQPLLPVDSLPEDSKGTPPQADARIEAAASGHDVASDDPPKRKRLGWGQGLARLQSKDTKPSGQSHHQVNEYIIMCHFKNAILQMAPSLLIFGWSRQLVGMRHGLASHDPHATLVKNMLLVLPHSDCELLLLTDPAIYRRTTQGCEHFHYCTLSAPPCEV